MPHKEQSVSVRIIDGLAEITRHHDRNILEKSLLKTLSDLFPGSIRLYRTLNNAAREHIDVSLLAYAESGVICSPPHQEKVTKSLSSAIEKVMLTGELSTAVSETDAGLWDNIYPTFDSHGDIFAVLVYTGELLSFNQQRLVHSILQVYTNYLSLLEKAQHDKLTGLLNRETLESELTKSIIQDAHRAREQQADDSYNRLNDPLDFTYIGLVDVDHFKAINDRFGHLFGDEILILTARLLKEGVCRQDDRVFRYGGEEFVVLLKCRRDEYAHAAFDRIRSAIEEHSFPQIGQVTASIGFARVNGQPTPSDVIGQADKALYYAKEHGRNQTINYADLVASGAMQDPHYSGDIDLF